MLVLSAAACGGGTGEQQAEQEASAAVDTQVTPGGASHVPRSTARHFDPGTLRVGDRFMHLVVTARDVRRVFEDSVWSGYVRFDGEITVSGVYQRHFDWPEPDALCFHVDDASADAVPDFAPDPWTSPGMKVWFCFTNPDAAITLLGSGETPVRATVIVDDYTVTREFTDVFDTARLVRVVTLGGPARQTLRDP